MPIYTVMDQETEETFDVNMKFTEFENYLKQNTNLKQVFSKFPAIGDPIRLGKRRPPDSFRDVLKNVGAHHKRNNINSW